MEGQILFWGYKEQESNLILPEHDDDDDDDETVFTLPALLWHTYNASCPTFRLQTALKTTVC